VGGGEGEGGSECEGGEKELGYADAKPVVCQSWMQSRRR